MASSRVPAWATTCALALLAVACGRPSTDAASSESAATESRASQLAVDGICTWRSGTLDSIAEFPNADLALSPDKKTLAFTSCADEKVPQQGALVDLASGKVTSIDDASAIHRVRFSPDGKYLSYAAFDRTADAKTIEVRIRAVDGSMEKRIPFWDASLPNARLAWRIEGFDVRFSPDGKNALILGYDVGDGSDTPRYGLLTTVGLAKEAAPIKLTAPGPFSSAADVTFAPDGSRALVLTAMPTRSQGIGEARPLRATEVLFGESPKAQTPTWAYAKTAGVPVIIGGSFDGQRVLRWDADPTVPSGGGRIAIVAIDGTVIEVSKDAGVYAGASRPWWDADMRDVNAQAARWVGEGAEKRVLFAGIANPGASALTLFSRLADGSKPAETIATDVSPSAFTGGFVSAITPKGGFLYPTASGALAIVEPAVGPASRTLVADKGDAMARFHALSPDGTKVLVALSGPSTGSHADYLVVDVATGTSTTLVPMKGAPLRFFGDLDGAWAPVDCLYDRKLYDRIEDDGSTLFFAEFAVNQGRCGRERVAPQMLRMGGDGQLATAVSLSDFTDATYPDFRPVGSGQALITHCDRSCIARLVNVPTLPASAPAPNEPAPPVKPADPSKPASPAKPASPTSKGGEGDDDAAPISDEPATSSSSRPRTPSSATGGAATEPAPAAPTTKTVEASSCAAAPGAGSGSWAPFAVVAIALGAALRRRKRAAVLAAGLALVGCSKDEDAPPATAAANVENAPSGPFAKSFVSLGRVDRLSVFGTAFAIRDTTRQTVRIDERYAPYFGGCVFDGCARMIETATNKVLDASTLGVFVDSRGSTNDPFWGVSPKSSWILFRKPSGDPDKPGVNSFLLPFSRLDHGEEAISLPPSQYDLWVNDTLIAQVLKDRVRVVDASNRETKLELTFPGQEEPALHLSADHGSLLVRTSAGAKTVTVADLAVHEVTGFTSLTNPFEQPLPAGSGFLFTAANKLSRRYTIASVSADGTMRTLESQAIGTPAVAPDGRFAYARAVEPEGTSAPTFQDAVVVVHEDGKPDVELTASKISSSLKFSADGKLIHATFAEHQLVAATDASGAMKRTLPDFEDGRIAVDLTMTPSATHAIVTTRAPQGREDDIVYVVELATGAKKAIVHSSGGTGAMITVEDAEAAPAIVVATQKRATLFSLAGDELATLADHESAFGWRGGWFYYLAKPATVPENGVWQRQLRAVSRDGKLDLPVGDLLHEIVAEATGRIETVPQARSITSFFIRSGKNVFAFVPPTYDPSAAPAPTPAPAPSGTTAPSGGDDEPATTGDDDAAPAAPKSSSGAPSDKPSSTNPPRTPSAKTPSAQTSEGSATETPSASSSSTTQTVETGGCSTAPRGPGGSGFGLVFLVGLVLRAMRRPRR